MSNRPRPGDLRTYTVTVHITYIEQRAVRARTLTGAYAAARAAAETDYKGAQITTAGYSTREKPGE